MLLGRTHGLGLLPLKVWKGLAERGGKKHQDPNCQPSNVGAVLSPTREAGLRSWALSFNPISWSSACSRGACEQRQCNVTLLLVLVFSKLKDGLRQNMSSKKHWGTKLSEQGRILCTSPQSKYYHMCIKRLLLFTECWHETPWKS